MQCYGNTLESVCGTTPAGTAANNAQIKKNHKLGAGLVDVGICRTAAAGKKKQSEWIDFFPLKHSQAINLTAGCAAVCICAARLFFQIPRGARARPETHTSILTLAWPLRLMQIEAS
jgi:hypothetical protein